MSARFNEFMKKTLSRQFIALLLIPVCIILVINFFIIIQLHQNQTQELKNYCTSTLKIFMSVFLLWSPA